MWLCSWPLCVFVGLQVIQLHNAFLHAALERSLLLQADVVRHIHNLLAVAKELSKVVESCDVQQTGGLVDRWREHKHSIYLWAQRFIGHKQRGPSGPAFVCVKDSC